MTNASLNALFAEKVAGYTMHLEPGCEWRRKEIPHFTASMDAVVPWMEKFSHQNGEENGGEPIVFRIYSPACADDVWTVEPVWMHHDGDIPETPVKDKSLPRACVLALLRAKGVGV
jgi:hypothetical protein